LACDFENDVAGAIPTGFTVAETNGTGTRAIWNVVDDDRAADGGRVLRLVETKNAGHTFNVLLGEQTCPADLAIDVAIRPESGEEDQGGGVVWRAQDAASYYVARWNPLETNLRVYKVVNGVRTGFASVTIRCD